MRWLWSWVPPMQGCSPRQQSQQLRSGSMKKAIRRTIVDLCPPAATDLHTYQPTKCKTNQRRERFTHTQPHVQIAAEKRALTRRGLCCRCSAVHKRLQERSDRRIECNRNSSKPGRVRPPHRPED